MEAINSNATQGASQTENASGKSGFDMITSVELMFAKLQNDLAVACCGKPRVCQEPY